MRGWIIALLAVSPLLADEPSPEELKHEVAALQAQLAAVRATEDAKLAILSQTVSACFAAMDKMATPPPKPPEPRKEEKK